jgi:RecG-like helicase
MPEHRSRLRTTISRWASPDQAEARELRKDTRKAGMVPIAEAPDREKVTVQGTLRTVTLRPRGGVPALEAELYDGSGAISLVWLGRRRIGGIAPGRVVRVQGRIGVQDGQRVMYNPRYELRPG